MNFDNLEIQQLNRTDLNILIDWASKEGWNPGKNDAEVFWNTDPVGFYGFFYEGNLIAAGAVISYSNEFGFMGLFIVKSEFRNSGIGRKLWYARRNILIQRLHKNASIGMDGVVAMQPFYKKGGFTKAFREERYEFVGREFPLLDHISTIDRIDFEKIVQYDISFFGCKRTQFLKGWLYMPESNAIQYKKNNEIVGYAVLRAAERGYKIGPLFANTAAIAEELFEYCLSIVPNQPVFLDIPTINEEAVSLVKRYTGQYVFECARMYYGTVPNSNVNGIFGITTFELG